MTDFSARLDALSAAGNLRQIPGDTGTDEIIDFSSNDYLGLAERTELQAQFMADEGNRLSPMTSSASRLLAARQADHIQLEATLRGLYTGRDVVLMNSGYHANTGMVPALASGGKTLILADKLVHASIIDGIMLSKSEFRRFPHNDFDRLERAIAAKSSGFPGGILVIVESVYSMDGDRADIEHLIDIKRRHPEVMLYVDEAHAFGVEGPRGLGLVAASSAPEMVDVVVGTFGKALASTGAFVAARSEIIRWAVNTARSLIFSTSLPPIVSRWTRFMIDTMTGMDAEREHLRRLGRILTPDERHIVPHIVGSAALTVELSRKLLDLGMKVLPIRTPTVPPGTERLRISLSAARTVDEVTRLRDAINRLTLQ